MITILAAAAIGLAPIALQTAAPMAPSAQLTKLSQENAALLRCSAAFALVSFGQANQDEAAMKWPAIDPRGREFFVRTLARLMDDTGMDRDALAQLASAEAQRLLDQDQLNEVMPACLLMLEASGV
jgi:hypothetical protein